MVSAARITTRPAASPSTRISKRSWRESAAPSTGYAGCHRPVSSEYSTVEMDENESLTSNATFVAAPSRTTCCTVITGALLSTSKASLSSSPTRAVPGGLFAASVAAIFRT